MPTSEFNGLPVELRLEILSIAAWAAAEVDKPWLCSIATTSRLIWSVVQPILYDTVCLSNDNLERIRDFRGKPGFALTRRLWSYSVRALSLSASIARTFGGVEHFEGWDQLFFRLYTEPAAGARFRPTRASLTFNQLSMPWTPQFQLPLLRRGLTHLRLSLSGDFRLRGGMRSLAPAQTDCVLRFVVLEEAAGSAALVDVLHPFFASLTSLERILVRLPLDAAQAAEIVHALQQTARATGEQRLWVAAWPPPPPMMPEYKPGVSFDEAKWTAGRKLGAR